MGQRFKKSIKSPNIGKLALLGSALLLSACHAANPNIRTTPAPTSTPSEKTSSNPAPLMSSELKVQSVIEEIMRDRKLVNLSLNRPAVDIRFGCEKISIPTQGPLLRDTYDCSRLIQYGWLGHRQGADLFYSHSREVDVRSEFSIDVTTDDKKDVVVENFLETRNLSVQFPEPNQDIFSAPFTTKFTNTRQDPSNGNIGLHTVWETDGELDWHVLPDRTLNLQTKAQFNFQYTPGKDSPLNAATSALSFSVPIEISFPTSASTGCQWPNGTFTYVSKDSSLDNKGNSVVNSGAGNIEMDSKGWTDKARGLSMKWPATCPEGT
jgi:hypothetical protein